MGKFSATHINAFCLFSLVFAFSFVSSLTLIASLFCIIASRRPLSFLDGAEAVLANNPNVSFINKSNEKILTFFELGVNELLSFLNFLIGQLLSTRC